MLKIYDYEHAHQFLKDSWEEKRQSNPAFSLRAWSKRLGFESNAPLSLMLNGKRPIPKKYIPKLISDLSLDTTEGLYLETLINYNRAKDSVTRDFYYQRLKEIAPQKDVKFLDIEKSKIMQNPLHNILLEAINLKNFDSSPKSIKEKLKIEASIAEIGEALLRLESFGLVKNIDGFWSRNPGYINSTDGVPIDALKKFHKINADHAKKAVDQQQLSERDISGHFFNLKEGDLPQIKNEIRSFVQHIMKSYDAHPGTGDYTYELNLQLFKVFGDNTNENTNA